MTVIEKLPGSPSTLDAEVTELEANVSAIDAAIELLYSATSQMIGDTAAALYGRTFDAATALEVARDRYDNSAIALRAYVVEMRAAHEAADAVVSTHQAHASELTNATAAVGTARSVLAGAEGSEIPSSAYARLEDGVVLARRREYRAQEAFDESVAAWEAARDRQVEAAEIAAAAIAAAMSESNDSLWDKVVGVFESIGDFVAAVGEWLAEALAEIGEFLLQFAGLALVFLAIVAVVAIIAGAALGIAGVLLVSAVIFAGVAAVLLLASLSAEAGGAPHFVKKYPVEVRTADPEGDGAMATTESYGALFDPDLRQLDDATKSAPTFENGTWKDGQTLRNELASVIRVVALRDQDTGEIVAWRVQLPSTQDWGVTGNSLNDLPTNVLHALAPEIQSQMEQAAWNAMEQAGVLDSDAPVMFNGWSQGGMTASELAIDARMNDREVSVVTAGSPIDSYRAEFAERGIRATSFTDVDLVSGLEGRRLTPHDIVTADTDFQQHFAWNVAHDAGTYGEMAGTVSVRPEDQQFFADFGEGTQEEIHVFEYQRRQTEVSAPGPYGEAPTRPGARV